MSLSKVLAKFGVTNKRYVTTTGLVVFDGVTKTVNGYSHLTHGHVTPVAKGHFHGGVDPEDEADDRWWLTDPAEVQRHLDAMAVAFPGWTFIAGDDDTPPAFGGALDTGRGRFDVLVLLRRDRGLPFAVVPDVRLGKHRGRLWKRSPHLYDSGALCIAAQSDWLPDEHTAATAVAWAAHWLANYTLWFVDSLDRWPTEGQDVA